MLTSNIQTSSSYKKTKVHYMFITTVFVLFLIKLRLSKNKSLHGTKKFFCGEVVVSNYCWVITCYHENS